MTTRHPLRTMVADPGKRARLHRILFGAGLRNGTGMFLPYDQGLEHGPRDFFANPAAGDPRYVFELAVECGFNGIAMQIGLAEKYYAEFAGAIPLIVKLNGKTDIPPDANPLSPLNASVEDAVRLGAEAVGYTLYVGSPVQAADFVQLRQVRQDADRFGIPLVIWAYPRGSAMAGKGGLDSLYAVDYAARTALELGADVVKVNFPQPGKTENVKSEYVRPWSTPEAMRQVVTSAGRSLVLVSGGSRVDDDAILEKARLSMDAGATGVIFGRNVWQRDREESLRFVARLRDLLKQYPSEP
jgi:fructose-bisphosphate aldolase, class I